METVAQTWLTDSLFSMLYAKLRKEYIGNRQLGKKTIHKAVQENFMSLSERERYFIRLYAIHGGSVVHVSKDADVTYKRARRVLDIAIRKMMSPECLVRARAIPEFKHFGDELSTSRVLGKQTVKRLAQSSIITDGDLIFWYRLGPKFLFRIPLVGEKRVVEILSHLWDKGFI